MKTTNLYPVAISDTLSPEEQRRRRKISQVRALLTLASKAESMRTMARAFVTLGDESMAYSLDVMADRVCQMVDRIELPLSADN